MEGVKKMLDEEQMQVKGWIQGVSRSPQVSSTKRKGRKGNSN